MFDLIRLAIRKHQRVIKKRRYIRNLLQTWKYFLHDHYMHSDAWSVANVQDLTRVKPSVSEKAKVQGSILKCGSLFVHGEYITMHVVTTIILFLRRLG